VPVGGIVGGVIGGLALVACIFTIVILVRRIRKIEGGDYDLSQWNNGNGGISGAPRTEPAGRVLDMEVHQS